MTKNIHDNPQAAGLYRAIALRWYTRYVEARDSAKMRGSDLPDHGRLSTTQVEADDKYAAALANWLFETPNSAEAVMALVHFTGILAAVASWLNNRVAPHSCGKLLASHRMASG